MYYFKRIEDGALFAGTRLPNKPEKFNELSQEEYEAAIAALEEEELTDGNSENSL